MRGATWETRAASTAVAGKRCKVGVGIPFVSRNSCLAGYTQQQLTISRDILYSLTLSDHWKSWPLGGTLSSPNNRCVCVHILCSQ